MSKKYKYKKFIKENVGQVKDEFAKYLDASANQPILVTERGKPKSVIIDYDFYLEVVLGKNKQKSNKKNEKEDVEKKKFTKASDFIGIGNPEGKKIVKNKATKFEDFIGSMNPEGKKIDIKKEINDAWTSKYKKYL